MTHFGYKTVPKDQKQQKVASVFSSVAPSYDIMNDVMSLGIHRSWKDQLISRLGPTLETRLIDVAGGTGDIGLRFLKAGGGNVTILDINPDMLEIGRQKASELCIDGIILYKFLENRLSFLEGNAQDLKGVTDNSFDAYTIAFGIRNCTDIDLVLKEAYRVLKPGGRLLVLEFSKVSNPLVKSIYDWYSFSVIPKMGEKIAKDKDSYQYLVESIRKFPEQEVFAQMIQEAGFKSITFENLTLGVAAIHSGFKL